MKKYFLSFALFALFCTAFAFDASAKDMPRRYGVGVDSTISTYHGDGRGVSGVYFINKFFGLQLIFGMDTTSVKLEDDFKSKYDTTVVNWNVTVRGLFPFVVSTEVNLNAVVGFTASGTSSDGFKPASYTNETQMKYKDGYQFSIDIGLRPEWFVTEHFSIHTQVGIGLNIITHDSSTASAGLNMESGEVVLSSKAKGVNVDFFKSADLLGQAGFTFWF